MSCGGAQKPGQGHTAQEYGCGGQVVGISGGETQQWSLVASPTFQNVLAFLCPWCWVVEHIVCEPEN